jgi:hypothetical protein
VYDIQNKVLVCDRKKQKPKVVNIFWYDLGFKLIFKMKCKIWQNLDIFKMRIYLAMINQKHVIYWGNYMNFY